MYIVHSTCSSVNLVAVVATLIYLIDRPYCLSIGGRSDELHMRDVMRDVMRWLSPHRCCCWCIRITLHEMCYIYSTHVRTSPSVNVT